MRSRCNIVSLFPEIWPDCGLYVIAQRCIDYKRKHYLLWMAWSTKGSSTLHYPSTEITAIWTSCVCASRVPCRTCRRAFLFLFRFFSLSAPWRSRNCDKTVTRETVIICRSIGRWKTRRGARGDTSETIFADRQLTHTRKQVESEKRAKRGRKTLAGKLGRFKTLIVFRDLCVGRNAANNYKLQSARKKKAC